jgi:transcriptional regulator with XRE-family HTH domain
VEKLEKLARLRDLRNKRDLTQEEVAQKIGVSRVTYTRWECGLVAPSVQDLIKLADFFNVSVDYLIGRVQ